MSAYWTILGVLIGYTVSKLIQAYFHRRESRQWSTPTQENRLP